MVNNLEREKNFTSSKKASLPLKKTKKENQIDNSTKRWKKNTQKICPLLSFTEFIECKLNCR